MGTTELKEIARMEPVIEQKEQGIRVIKEVPLTWLITGLIVVCCQAAIVYFGQVRQGEVLAGQSQAIKDLATKIDQMNTLISTSNIKDVEHDFKLLDHERRLVSIETRNSAAYAATAAVAAGRK